MLLLIALTVVNPRRLTRQTRLSRIASLALVALIGLANTVSLVLLLRELLASQVQDGRALLVAALQVWLTNVIVFGLAYWELDRGGPVTRTQKPRDQFPPGGLPVLPGREPRQRVRGRRGVEQDLRAGCPPCTTTCTSRSPTPPRSARRTPCR